MTFTIRRLLWLGLALLALTHQASLAQTIQLQPTQFVPGDAVISPAGYNQLTPAIAAGSNTLLAVWSDNRSNAHGGEGETSYDIYAMRLDTSGNPLDTTPIPVAAGPGSQDIPKVAWNGTNWLVVFESIGLSGTGYYYEKTLQAVRVAPSGQVLDAKPINLFGLLPTAGYWDVASDGNNWVVANQGTASFVDVIAVRISPAGIVLDPPIRRLVPGTYYMRSNFQLAYAGGVFMLTFNDDYVGGTYATKAVRFDSNLNLLDAGLIPLINVPLNRLAANSSGFYIVWNQSDVTTVVTGSRVNTAGQKLDGNGVNISGQNQPTAYTTTSVTWDGTNWKVTWGNNNAVRVARVNSVGQVLDPGGVAVNGPSTGVTASPGNGSVQIVWVPYVDSNYDILTANISAGNGAGPNRNISLGAPSQLRPDLATNDNGYMLVYRSVTGNQVRILAQPLDANGAPMTGEPVQLATGTNTNNPGYPTVAWNGSLYLATWNNSTGIVAQRLQPDGTKIDATPFTVMTSTFGPTDVAALGDTFLVVGLRCGYTCEYISTVAARVRGSDGVVLDPAGIDCGYTYASSPRVVKLGARWLVAYQNNATHDDSNASTLGIFINLDGTKTGIFSLHDFYSSAGGNGIFSLGLASNGNVAALVQSQELTSGVENDLLVRIINADGSVQPYINLTPWAGNQYRPQVAWDGTYFVVVYQDQKNRLAEQSLEQLDARADLYGMRLTTAGAKVDPQGFVFSNSPYGEVAPTVVASNGVSLIAGSIIRQEAPYANYRIGYSRFGLGGNKWPVASMAANPTGGNIPLTISFSSAGSTDLDGSIASYLWDFGDGATSTSANPAHAYTTAGPFVATLTVTDNGGAQSTQAILVKAVAPNQLPVANASSDVSGGPAPLDVVFSAFGSYDPDGALGNIEWTFSDGGSYWGGTAYHTFYQPGTYLATLRVYDSRGATGIDTLQIVVGQQNQPPVAVASATPLSGNPPLTVNFTGSNSYDSDGSIVSYAWDFGDGGSSTQANPTHVYTSGGQYVATLEVTDNWGATDTASVTINVNCTSQCLRSTNIALSARLQGSTVSVTGKVTVQTETGAKAANAIVYATFTLPGGLTVDLYNYTNSRGIATFNTTYSRGTYTLTITDIVKTGYRFDPAHSVLSKSITR